MKIPDINSNTDNIIGKVINARKKSKLPFKIKIAGNSMLPLIYDEDYVEVVNIPYSNIHIGDILVFTYGPGKIIIHRLIWKWKSHLYTKGDNAIAIEKINQHSILGKVSAIFREGKKFVIYSRQTTPIIAILSLFYRLLFYIYAKNYKKLINSFTYRLYIKLLSLVLGVTPIA